MPPQLLRSWGHKNQTIEANAKTMLFYLFIYNKALDHADVGKRGLIVYILNLRNNTPLVVRASESETVV